MSRSHNIRSEIAKGLSPKNLGGSALALWKRTLRRLADSIVFFGAYKERTRFLRPALRQYRVQAVASVQAGVTIAWRPLFFGAFAIWMRML